MWQTWKLEAWVFQPNYLAPGGGCEVLFVPCLSVCVCVCLCVCVCVSNILVFHFSAVKRDIDLQCIQDSYSVVLIGQGQGHRDGTLLFDGTVISQKLTHRKISIFFHRHFLWYSIRWNNKNLSEQRNYVTKKYVNIAVSVPNLVTIGRHLTSFLTCAAFNM